MKLAFIAVFVMFLSILPRPAMPQTSGISGNCSPILTHVSVTGNIQFQCDLGKRELSRFARQLSDVVKALHLSEEQISKLVATLNDILPDILSQLARIEGKQDQALDGITELIRMGVRPSTSPQDIQALVEKTKKKHLAGIELSACGCWGKPFFSDEQYGAVRRNPECLSEKEETVACVMMDGQNICRGFFAALFGQVGYAPWMRVCR